MLKKKLLTDRSGQLQEQILEQKAQELANEVDDQVLREMLVELGWHEVMLWVMTHEQGQELDLWAKTNIKGRFWTRGLVWLFEDNQDAMWFKLRWLSQ